MFLYRNKYCSYMNKYRLVFIDMFNFRPIYFFPHSHNLRFNRNEIDLFYH